MGDKTRIEWCDSTWNPVTGCLRGCEYCYARRIAERFGGWTTTFGVKTTETYPGLELDKPLMVRRKEDKIAYAPFPYGFEPTFHRYRLDIPERWAKPRTIFVCSVADLFGRWVPVEWIMDVLDACQRAPQHRYLFLTKNTDRYLELDYMALLPHEENFWYGTSVTSNEAAIPYPGSSCGPINTFWSMEPLLGPVDMSEAKGVPGWVAPGWVILGAETGNRRDKVRPQKKWIDSIVAFCDAHGVPLLMKDSLIPIVGAENMRRDFPWAT